MYVYILHCRRYTYTIVYFNCSDFSALNIEIKCHYYMLSNLECYPLHNRDVFYCTIKNKIFINLNYLYMCDNMCDLF